MKFLPFFILLVLIFAAGCTDAGDEFESLEPDIQEVPKVSDEPILGLLSLTVLSDPPFSSILIDGNYVGAVTPEVLYVNPGTYTVSIVTSAGKKAEEIITLNGDASVSLIASLDNNLYGESLSESDLTKTGFAVIRAAHPYVHVGVAGKQITKESVRTPYVIAGLRETDHFLGILDNTGGWTEYSSNTGMFSVYSRMYSPVNFARGSQTLELYAISSEAYNGYSYSVDGEISRGKIPEEWNYWSGYTYLSVETPDGIISFPRGLSLDTDVTVEPRDVVWNEISVTSNPDGADIFIDGFPTGKTTPWTIANVSDGFHKVTVTKHGYLPMEKDVQLLSDGRMTSVNFGELTSYANGYLLVESSVPGAFVMLHGVDTGDKTPVVYPAFPIGTVDVTVITSGGKSVTKQVTVLPGQVTKVFAEV